MFCGSHHQPFSSFLTTLYCYILIIAPPVHIAFIDLATLSKNESILLKNEKSIVNKLTSESLKTTDHWPTLKNITFSTN